MLSTIPPKFKLPFPVISLFIAPLPNKFNTPLFIVFEDTTNLFNTASKTALSATVTLFCSSLPKTVVLPSLTIKLPVSVILVKAFVPFSVAVPLFSKSVILLFLITAFEAVRTLLALILSA